MKKAAPFVSLVVVNHNGKQFLKECFKALLKLNYPAGRTEILMVDNCSDDGSVSFVRKNFSKVKVLKNDVNNYARANNLGIIKAKGDFIALVNNDVQVSRNWLLELIKVMHQEKRCGIAGGKILLEDGRLQSTGHEEYPDFYWGDRGFQQENKGQYGRLEEVQSLCGAAVIFRKACLEEIGSFDEDFVMYLEDVDICLRGAKKKWKVIYVPKCIAKHYFRGSSSDESVRYFSERNRLLLIAKHFPTQLGKALFGKGYFTAGDNSVFDIFPLIFKKLSESQSMDALKNNLPVIFKNLKNIAVLEKNVLMDRTREFKRIVIQKETSLTELNRANAQLQEQLKKALSDIESKGSLLLGKESSLAELGQVIVDLQGQVKKTLKDLALKDALLREKETSLNELNRANAQLQEQLKKALSDIESRSSLLHEKEAALTELNRVNGQLQEQFQGAVKEIETKNSLLLEKQTALEQKETQLNKTKEELMISNDDLEKVVRFDQKIKILLVKPQKITIEDAEETIRIIKKKYPNSSVYLFANLLRQDYEKISKNNNIEKSLIYCQSGSKPFLSIPKLYNKLFLARFDMAVTLASHKSRESSFEHKKSRLLTILSSPKNQYVYYVD